MKYLPLTNDLETKPIFKKLNLAHRALAELKGITEIIPNQTILINTLSLQEAKESSAIENIITTQDELYSSDTKSNRFATVAAKEVHNYVNALHKGYQRLKKDGVLTATDIEDIQAIVVQTRTGFRRLPGTELKNEITGEVVYTPPQEPEEIVSLMRNLEQFINDSEMCHADPLVKMAVIHHQFESIHPFYDGNGRTGRIINILYLVKEGLLDLPILYLSRFIHKNRGKYYRLLQAVREDSNSWEEWILFTLEGVTQTASETTRLVRGIHDLMLSYKHQIREKLPKIYSQALLNNLFRHPYTKIAFLEKDLKIHRNTARKYLSELENLGLLKPHKMKNEVYYINSDLFALFQR